MRHHRKLCREWWKTSAYFLYPASGGVANAIPSVTTSVITGVNFFYPVHRGACQRLDAATGTSTRAKRYPNSSPE